MSILPPDTPVVYKTACVTWVHSAPRSLASYDIPTDSLIPGHEVPPPGWVAWVGDDGKVLGYLHRGDLDQVSPP